MSVINDGDRRASFAPLFPSPFYLPSSSSSRRRRTPSPSRLSLWPPTIFISNQIHHDVRASLRTQPQSASRQSSLLANRMVHRLLTPISTPSPCAPAAGILHGFARFLISPMPIECQARNPPCPGCIGSRAQGALPPIVLHKAWQRPLPSTGEFSPRRVHRSPRTRCPQLSRLGRRQPAPPLDRYIAEHPHRGPNVWPSEDTRNDLAVALFCI